jgi:hypothetical protein
MVSQYERNGQMRIGRLNVGIAKCSDAGNYSLASWQYRTGYWRWCLHYQKCKIIDSFKWPMFGPSYNSGKMYSPSKGYFGMWFKIPLIGFFSLSTQRPNKSMQ